MTGCYKTKYDEYIIEDPFPGHPAKIGNVFFCNREELKRLGNNCTIATKKEQDLIPGGSN